MGGGIAKISSKIYYIMKNRAIEFSLQIVQKFNFLNISSLKLVLSEILNNRHVTMGYVVNTKIAKQLRKDLGGITQNQLVEKINKKFPPEDPDEDTLSLRTIQRIEQNESVGKNSIKILAEFYGVSFSKLGVRQEEKEFLDSSTRLHTAVRRNDTINNIKKLLDDGYGPNAKDENGRTPLHVAILHDIVNLIEVVEVLLDYGADVNAQDNDGNTALHYCAMKYPDEVIEVYRQLPPTN